MDGYHLYRKQLDQMPVSDPAKSSILNLEHMPEQEASIETSKKPLAIDHLLRG